MSSSCVEELDIHNTSWFQIVKEMLSSADIAINGVRPFDIQVKNPDLYKRVLREGSLGLGESYMDGWWECERLDIFFHRVLRAGLDNKLPKHVSDIARVLIARLTNLQSKKRAWIVGKEHYDLGNDLFSLMPGAALSTHPLARRCLPAVKPTARSPTRWVIPDSASPPVVLPR